MIFLFLLAMETCWILHRHAYADWNRLQQTNSETESALYANQSASDAAIATLKEMNDGSDFSDETLASIAGIEANIKSLAEGNEALHTAYVAETIARIEQLQNDLGSIEASNIWERNLKTVLQLRAEKLLNQSDDWNNEQREALQQIADQCRYEGGIGVVLARAELDISRKYNDEEMCPDLTEERARGAAIITATIIPNPAHDYCQVLLPSAQEAQIELRDLHGRTLLYRNTLGDVVTHLDISNLASGLYLIEIKTSKGKETHKLIVSQ